MWIVRLVVDDENLTKDIYESIESMGLKFDLKYGSNIFFYVKVNDIMKGLEMIKELNAKFKRKFDNNIYEAVERRFR